MSIGVGPERRDYPVGIAHQCAAAFEQPDRLACLGAFLARELAREPAFGHATDDVQLDEETLERLRALGYVE